MRRYRARMIAALGVAAAVAFGVAAGMAAVPPYDDTVTVYPTEAAFLRTIAVYQQAVTTSPEDAQAYHWLGYAYWHASVLSRDGLISYGDDYATRAITDLERAVSLDPKDLGAWLLLVEAYATTGQADKADAAAYRLNALSSDLSVYTGAMPVPVRVSGLVTTSPPPAPAAPPGYVFHPQDFFVIGDPATKKLYKFACPSLPPMQHPAFFLTKWEAYQRGYTPATVCTP